MYSGLTKREEAIIQTLLAEKEITKYKIVGETSEGADLPGSTCDGEIELLSGTIVTEDAAYDFWLDWRDGTYVLHPWRQLTSEQIQLFPSEIREAQQQLRQTQR